MRPACPALSLAVLLIAAPASAADTLRVELNALEPAQSRCRLSFVVENKTPQSLDTLKLDLAVFNAEGVIQRRLAVDVGPVRKAKTIVKAFELDGDCAEVGAVLVNDVTACTPLEPSACVDQLALTSRPKGVKFYK